MRVLVLIIFLLFVALAGFFVGYIAENRIRRKGRTQQK